MEELEIKDYKKREPSIELLRIISGIGVIILHFNSSNVGNALYIVDTDSFNYYLLKFMECLSICSVNLFIIISSYFLSRTNKRRISKLVSLIIQIVVFKLVLYLIDSCVLHTAVFDIKTLLQCFLPTNYFVFLYLSLYLVSPYINIIIGHLDRNQFKRVLLLLMLLFSVWPFFLDCLGVLFSKSSNLAINLNEMNTIGLFGDQSGYTIVNFALMYFIGAYTNKFSISFKTNKLILYILISITFIFIPYLYSEIMLNYNNPIVILLAILIFILFKNMNIKNTIINEISKATFTSYILNVYLIPYLPISKIVLMEPISFAVVFFVICISIYFLSYLVYKIYNFLLSPLNKMIRKVDNILINYNN